MKNFIKFFLISLIAISCHMVNAESCNFLTKLTFQDGTNGCVESLPFANDVPNEQKDKLINLIKFSKDYFVAKSRYSDCKAIGFRGAYTNALDSRLLINYNAALPGLKKAALDSCMNQGCDCEMVLDSGNVLVDKDILLAGRSMSIPNPATVIVNEIKSNQSNDGNNDKNQLTAESKIQDNSVQLKLKEQEKLLLEAKLQEELTRSRLKEQERLLSEYKLQEQKISQAKLKEQERLILDTKLQESLAISKLKEQERLLVEAKQKEEQRLVELRKVMEQEIREKILNEMKIAQAAIPIEKPQPIIYANRKALVIGNDSYQTIEKLKTAKEDAKLMAEVLASLGFQVNLSLDVTEKKLKADLRNFKNLVRSGDEVMIFYAGHGVQIDSTNYLLPIDVSGQNEEEVKDEAIALQRLLDDMTEKKAKLTLAVIDACRDNPFKTATRSIGTRGLAPTSPATGQMIVFSAGNNQLALDTLGPNDKAKNGVFTRVFSKEVQQAGISIDRVVRTVRTQVVDLARSVGHNQVPAIYDQVVGDFYFKK